MKRTVMIAVAGALLLAADKARPATAAQVFQGEPGTMLLVGSSLVALASIRQGRRP